MALARHCGQRQSRSGDTGDNGGRSSHQHFSLPACAPQVKLAPHSEHCFVRTSICLIVPQRDFCERRRRGLSIRTARDEGDAPVIRFHQLRVDRDGRNKNWRSRRKRGPGEQPATRSNPVVEEAAGFVPRPSRCQNHTASRSKPRGPRPQCRSRRCERNRFPCVPGHPRPRRFRPFPAPNARNNNKDRPIRGKELAGDAERSR